MVQSTNISRAVIVATNGRANFASGQCSAMMPLVDRPFVQHVVECLIDRGVKRIDFLLHDHAEEVESHFGDGQRWGAQFRFHLVRDPDFPYGRLRNIFKSNKSESFFLVHADQLQPEKWSEVIEDSETELVVFGWQHESSSDMQSAGAACLSSSQLDRLPFDKTREEFENQLVTVSKDAGSLVLVSKPLAASSFQLLLESQKRVLNREFPELIRFSGSGGDEGVWVGRNVYLETVGARFEPPVYIGSNCTIEGVAQIGPNVVISDGAFVNPKCEINNTLIMPDSLIGEGLAIDGCIVDRHQFLNVEHEVAVSVDDDLLMGSTRVQVPGRERFRRLCSRLVAMLTLMLFSPLLLLLAFRQKLHYGAMFDSEEAVKLPARVGSTGKVYRRLRFKTRSTADSNWHHLWLDVLPGLINVARGDLGWVGVTPLAPQDLKQLPEDLREKYSLCEAGLINESTVMYGQFGSRDERLIAEIYYAVAIKTTFARLKRIAAYFVSVFRGPRARRGANRFLQVRISRANVS